MENPKDWAVASVDSCEKPQWTGGSRIGNVESTTDWTWKEQANYNTQRDIDKKKAQQTQSTQVAELMGRQQQVNIVSHGNHAPQAQLLPQISHPQQFPQPWQWDQAGHYYQQLYDNNAQHWYTVWWDYNESRAYRTLKDEYGREYTAWV